MNSQDMVAYDCPAQSAHYVHLLQEVSVAANEALNIDAALLMALQGICRITGWPAGRARRSTADGGLEAGGLWQVHKQYHQADFLEFRRKLEAQGDVEADRFVKVYSLQVGEAHCVSAILEFYSTRAQPLSPEMEQVVKQIGVQLTQGFENQTVQRALQASERRSRQIIDSAADAFIAMDSQGIITAWNQAAESIFGWLRDEAVGRSVADTIIPESYRNAHHRGMQRFLGDGNSKVLGQRLELPALHRSGREFPIEITLWSLEEEHEPSFFAFAHDISDRKKAERELEHRALHDTLTGLPNRSLALDRLQHCLSRRQEDGSCLAVLFVDLDHFKRINDSFGHEAGDQVLVTMAQRLSRAVRPADTVARLAGDEFVVLCPDIASHRDAARVASRLLDEMAPAIALKDDKVFVSASVGIAIATDNCSAEKLIGSADIAMYEAKSSGRGQFQLFDSKMQMQVAGRISLENDLHQALVREEFQLYFQPIIAASSGTIVRVEALLRWQHPQRGMIPPTDFIPIAEETGLIVPIGNWVVEEACRIAQTWNLPDDVSIPLGVSVNLSARQLLQSDLVDTVQKIFAAYEFDPARIEFGFEVTETAVMQDPDAAATTLQALRELGAHVLIDDFGTGYSSLAYLKRFPVDTLKIDQSFVSNITSDSVDQAIVRAVTDMAHSMNLLVVAEGVETAEQAQALKHLAVDLQQGYLYAHPLPAEQLTELLISCRTA